MITGIYLAPGNTFPGRPERARERRGTGYRQGPTPREGTEVNRRRLAVLLLAPALSLTACGGGGDGKSAASSSSAPAPEPSSGVTVPAGPGGGSGGGGGGTGGSAASPGAPQVSSAPTKVVNDFVACMRAHGVKVPDDVGHWQPTPSPGDTKMQAALLACMKSAGAK
ncbi:hypothetical protein GCM10009727_92250 [Actinomadura napierensis]|uniref:Uncharacterized protein n=1 Tax=Actinomadura napierensis TaxID=267854 RepID=A0ABN3AHN5_9ACTN